MPPSPRRLGPGGDVGILRARGDLSVGVRGRPGRRVEVLRTPRDHRNRTVRPDVLVFGKAGRLLERAVAAAIRRVMEGAEPVDQREALTAGVGLREVADRSHVPRSARARELPADRRAPVDARRCGCERRSGAADGDCRAQAEGQRQDKHERHSQPPELAGGADPRLRGKGVHDAHKRVIDLGTSTSQPGSPDWTYVQPRLRYPACLRPRTRRSGALRRWCRLVDGRGLPALDWLAAGVVRAGTVGGGTGITDAFSEP